MPANEHLQEYRKKRQFSRTPEPAGNEVSPHQQPIFVIQKHDASHLHYDFRIEAEGVLKSWAVPKGPTTDPGVRHLAIQTEDHPLEYATFEGIIPAGEYGGGTVMVWDYGVYDNYSEKDGHSLSIPEAIANGQVVVWLEGKKLRGGYALIRTRVSRGRESWLLIKMHDEWAKAGEEITTTEPDSALTGRGLETIEIEGQQKAA